MQTCSSTITLDLSNIPSRDACIYTDEAFVKQKMSQLISEWDGVSLDRSEVTITGFTGPVKGIPTVIAYIQKGEYIRAIRHARIIYNIGLKEAKDMVDSLKGYRAGF